MITYICIQYVCCINCTLFVCFDLVSDLLCLFARDSNGAKVLICDEGVYTKNRNFRIYLSSKLGKTATLQLPKESNYEVSLLL